MAEATMKARELAREMRQAFGALHPADFTTFGELRIPAWLILNWQVVGRVLVCRIGNDLYEPDPDGIAVFVTPVLTHYPDTPESLDPESAVRCGALVDLVAWHPKCPNRWRLRTGAATWAGAIPPQLCNPDPVRIWRTPLGWFQADCTGLCLLSSDRPESFRILSACVGGILPEDERHKHEIKRLLERPWPAPEVRNAA
jgi:hypothetical protein